MPKFAYTPDALYKKEAINPVDDKVVCWYVDQNGRNQWLRLNYGEVLGVTTILCKVYETWSTEQRHFIQNYFGYFSYASFDMDIIYLVTTRDQIGYMHV